jgi:hypothetical protein
LGQDSGFLNPVFSLLKEMLVETGVIQPPHAADLSRITLGSAVIWLPLAPIPLLEAFLTAAHRTAEFYKTEGRLATEHPLIDDNTDGRGTPTDWFRGIRVTKQPEDNSLPDGLRAHQLHLVLSQSEQKLPLETRARRNALEQQLAEILTQKSALEERALGQKGEAKPEGIPAMWIPEGEAKDG